MAHDTGTRPDRSPTQEITLVGHERNGVCVNCHPAGGADVGEQLTPLSDVLHREANQPIRLEPTSGDEGPPRELPWYLLVDAAYERDVTENGSRPRTLQEQKAVYQLHLTKVQHQLRNAGPLRLSGEAIDVLRRREQTLKEILTTRLFEGMEPEIGPVNGLGTGAKALYNESKKAAVATVTLGYVEAENTFEIDPASDLYYGGAATSSKVFAFAVETVLTGGAARFRYAGKLITLHGHAADGKDLSELANGLIKQGLTEEYAFQLAGELITRRGGKAGGNGAKPGIRGVRQDIGGNGRGAQANAGNPPVGGNAAGAGNGPAAGAGGAAPGGGTLPVKPHGQKKQTNSGGLQGTNESGLEVVPRRGMDSRVVTDANGRTVTIYGQSSSSSKTPGHATTIENQSERMARSGEYESVLMQRSPRTSTGRLSSDRSLPDLTGVRRDGRVDFGEVQSSSDDPVELMKRMERSQELLPPERRGVNRVFQPDIN